MSLRSRSSGAVSPGFGVSATGIGGGGGDSHGCTVSGRALTDIQAGQLDFSSSSSRPGSTPGDRSDRVLRSLLGSGSGDDRLKVSDEMPILRMASLVGGRGGRRESRA